MEATRTFLAMIFPNHQYSPEFPNFDSIVVETCKAMHGSHQEWTGKCEQNKPQGVAQSAGTTQADVTNSNFLFPLLPFGPKLTHPKKKKNCKQIQRFTQCMDNNRGKNLQYQLACSAYIQLSLIQQPSLKSLDPNPPLFLQKERNHMTVTTKLNKSKPIIGWTNLIKLK